MRGKWGSAVQRHDPLPAVAGLVPAVAGVILIALPCAGRADVQPVTQKGGPPYLPIPTYQETGLPDFTMPVGTPTLPPSGNQGGGDPTGGDPGTPDPTGGGGAGDTTPALGTMTNQTWGNQAVSIAQGLGVNPNALAGLCVAESGCQNIPNGSGGSATGPFQMIPTTFAAMYAAAVADNPALAQSTTGNINDPASEAAAAAELIKQEATTLRQAGVSNPTWIDVRAGYAFGNSYMAAVAQAPDSEPLGQILTGWNSNTYQMNGLTPATTVGQWRMQQSGRAGSAARQSVLM